MRVFSLPAHFWNDKFFAFLSKIVGCFICSKEATSLQTRLDVARFLIRTRCVARINELLCVKINGMVVRLKLIEDTQGSLRVLESSVKDSMLFSSDSDLEDDEGGKKGDVGEGLWKGMAENAQARGGESFLEVFNVEQDFSADPVKVDETGCMVLGSDLVACQILRNISPCKDVSNDKVYSLKSNTCCGGLVPKKMKEIRVGPTGVGPSRITRSSRGGVSRALEKWALEPLKKS